MPNGYLHDLTVRLTRGLSRAPAGLLETNRDYLIGRQNGDGGFSGREGGSDLYYTGFALRGLACLGSLTDPAIGRAAGFLRGRLLEPASVVDFMSLLYAARLLEASGGPAVLSEHDRHWPDRVARALEEFRKPDGGYAKSTEGTAGSTYHTFLVSLCYELIGIDLPDPSRVVDFVNARRRDDGGYVEVAAARRGGTNPTAAAVALLIRLGGMDASTAAGVAPFLAAMQGPEGGLRANDRAPAADLLSTFTSLLTLSDLGAIDRIDRTAALRYVEGLALATGGFRAGLWDAVADVEYTFYGLGSWAILHG